MEKLIVFHVVSGKKMKVNQIIEFNDNNLSGVYKRVMEYKHIYDNLKDYKLENLSHHEKVAVRELFLEEVRCEKFPEYPSRLNSLYVSKNLEDAYKWANYFISLNREILQIVKLEVNGKSLTRDAHNCFEPTLDENINREFSNNYWMNLPNRKGISPLYETVVTGKIKVIDIIKEY